jgi:hypothetical protein
LRNTAGELLVDCIPLALRRLKELGVSTWAVIHCPEGGYGIDEKGAYVSADSLHLTDGYIKGTVGAGDAFCAGVLYGAYCGYSLGVAIELGTAAAACSLSESGAERGHARRRRRDAALSGDEAVKAGVRSYGHFGDCLWLGNGVWEMAVSLCFGPRILRFSLAGRENVFYEQPEDADYLCTPDGWRVFGGTRLWLAPESEHPLYAPDLLPVAYECSDGEARVIQPEDPRLHAEKRIVIRETEEENSVEIDYQIRNTGGATLRRAVGGQRHAGRRRADGAVFGGKRRDYGQTGRFLSLWNTTSLGDARRRLRRKPFKYGSCRWGRTLKSGCSARRELRGMKSAIKSLSSGFRFRRALCIPTAG